MSVTDADIKNLRADLKRQIEALERDLEVLEKADAIFNRWATGANIVQTSHNSIPPSIPNGSGRDLRGVVLQILSEAKMTHESLRPTEIVKAAWERQYPFKDDRSAMSSVTKLLTRLLRKGLIEKLKDGTYTGK